MLFENVKVNSQKRAKNSRVTVSEKWKLIPGRVKNGFCTYTIFCTYIILMQLKFRLKEM